MVAALYHAAAARWLASRFADRGSRTPWNGADRGMAVPPPIHCQRGGN
jgi:hypothetical protein